MLNLSIRILERRTTSWKTSFRARADASIHNRILHGKARSAELPHLDFPEQTNTARTTQPDFSQRIDTVFFKRHVDDWKVRIKSQIKGELEVNPTGQALADLIHKEQQILANEVRWLQDKAWKARRRAGERKEHRNKTQNTLLKRISLLTTALAESTSSHLRIGLRGPPRRPYTDWDSYTSDPPSKSL